MFFTHCDIIDRTYIFNCKVIITSQPCHFSASGSSWTEAREGSRLHCQCKRLVKRRQCVWVAKANTRARQGKQRASAGFDVEVLAL